MNKTTVSAAAVALAFQVFAIEGKFRADKDADCLIAVKDGVVADISGRIAAGKISAEGVEIVRDADFGEVMRFTGGKGVVIPDEGKIGFGRGLTIEAWIFLEEELKETFAFAKKGGKGWQHWSFSTQLAEGNKFTLGLLGFEGEPLDFTEDEKKHQWGFRPDKSYGGRGGNSNGNTPIPVGKWAHVAFTYDASRALHRLWVNGSVDRECFREHTLTKTVCDRDDEPVMLCPKVRGVRVAQFRLSPCARDLGATPPVKVFIHENAYRGEGYVHIKPLRDNLPLPVEVEVMNIHVPFMSKINTAVMESVTKPINVAIPKHRFGCVMSDLVVKLKKGGRELWRQESLIINPSPVTAPMSRMYRREGPHDASVKPEWWINKDNTFTYKGKPILPLMVYFGRPQYFDLLADIGFNMIGMRKTKGVTNWDWAKVVEPFYAKAAERGITIRPGKEVEGRPGQGFVFAFDEPYGYTFERMREKYMRLRNGRVHSTTLPIVATQNNVMRYRETSMCCDILAPDPYNKGRDPLRNIYDSISAACADVDYLKPVMCIVGNYGTDKYRPDSEELRTMCYLAFAAGATALGFYSWDEGEEPGGPMDTAKKPEQIAAYRRLFKEFKELEPALTTANVGIPKVEPADPRGFFPCIKKGRDGKIYLIVCSDLYRSAMKRIVIPSAKGRKAKLLFGPDREGRMKVKPEVVFSERGAGEFAMPPVSSAVYVFEK